MNKCVKLRDCKYPQSLLHKFGQNFQDVLKQLKLDSHGAERARKGGRSEKPVEGMAESERVFTWTAVDGIITSKNTATSIHPTLSYKTEKMNSTPSGDNIVWVDLEMTGLDPESCHILEAACLVTDKNINIIAEGPNLVIHQPLEILNTMDDWCMTHHKQTGLYKESLESKISLQQAENELLKFVQKYTLPGKCPLAGNSVYMDKLFLLKYMPRFCKHLHYRILDVSSVKILAKNWYNLDPSNKAQRHRASDDIKGSINELLFYRKSIFQPLHHAAASSASGQ